MVIRQQIIAGLAMAATLAAQTPAPQGGAAAPAAAPKPAAQRRPAAAAAGSGPVDTVIQLVKAGMSESMVVRTLQREGKPANLSTADLLKLQKAGVSENIINAMMDPGGAAPATTPATTTARASSLPATTTSPMTATPAVGGAATPFPAAFGTAGPQKRRLAIKPFEYATVKTWVNYWFHSDYNLGDGIRSMLQTRMHQSKNIVIVERAQIKDLMGEQDFGATNRVNQGTKAKIGKISGADVMLYGDIVIFGRDDTTKHKGLGGALGAFSPAAGRIAVLNKEEKAVVAIALRLVDAETGETIETAEARGESSRKSKDYAGALGVAGAGAAAGSAGVNSSNFEQTIIGEATSDAVNKVVEFLNTKVPLISAKARSIEGRVTINAGATYLTVGANDGVQVGDRFEIGMIKGVVIDPETKAVLDKDSVKVGEFVVHSVREKVAMGEYGGQPLSASYANGYTARLMEANSSAVATAGNAPPPQQ